MKPKQVSLPQLADEMDKCSSQLKEILTNINVFDFEIRKQIETILTDLFNSNQAAMVRAFYPYKEEIAQDLLEKYSGQDLTVICGSILRLFTRSGKLVMTLATIPKLEKLTELV